MSTSKGKGMSFAEGVDFFPGAMLRYLLLRSRPNSVVDFDPEKNDILLLCDQFDRTERIHFGIDDAKEDDRKVQSSLYTLCTGGHRTTFAPQIPLNLASTMVQITLSKEAAFEKLVELGHLPHDLEGEARKVVEERIALAERWVSRFASEQFLFRLVSTDFPCSDLSAEEIEAVSLLVGFLEGVETPVQDSKTLQNGLYAFARERDVEPKTLFSPAYHALINKERGPQLSNFILTIGVEKTISLLQAGIDKSRQNT